MNASLLAVLNDAERLLVAETERDQLAALDEDAAIELESRIRRACNKYVTQYRRGAVLARQAAAELRAERLAEARAAKQGRGPGGQVAAPSANPRDHAVGAEAAAARALRSPRTEKQRAGTLAMGARRQAKRWPGTRAAPSGPVTAARPA